LPRDGRTRFAELGRRLLNYAETSCALGFDTIAVGHRDARWYVIFPANQPSR
jgi:hypothetical protein